MRNSEKRVEYSVRVSIYTELHRPLSVVVDTNTSERHDIKGSVMLQRKDNVTQNPLRHLGGGLGVSVCDFLQKLGSKQGPVQLFGDINVC